MIRDQAAEAFLYTDIAPTIRAKVRRLLGEWDVDDKVHDIFIEILTSIRKGHIRQPERLMGFVDIIIERRAYNYIKDAIRDRALIVRSGSVANRRRDSQNASDMKNPEQSALDHELGLVVMGVLRTLLPLDREIIMRFYFNGDSKESISAELGLTENQFRLTKSHAVALVGKKVREIYRRRRDPKLPAA